MVDELTRTEREYEDARRACNVCATPYPDHAAECLYHKTAAELAELRAKVQPDYHVYERIGLNWSCQHPLKCRLEGMLNCDVHLAISEEADRLHHPPGKEGRWRVDLLKGDLVFKKLPK